MHCDRESASQVKTRAVGRVKLRPASFELEARTQKDSFVKQSRQVLLHPEPLATMFVVVFAMLRTTRSFGGQSFPLCPEARKVINCLKFIVSWAISRYPGKASEL